MTLWTEVNPITTTLGGRRQQRNDSDGTKPSFRYGLSAREMVVLGEMTKGLSDMQIAEALGITKFTVNKHIGSILIKTDTRSRTGAAVRAIREHLVD